MPRAVRATAIAAAVGRGHAARPLRVLTIAGSDSAGAAGIQADQRTFAALGCHGLVAVTAVTAQDTRGVQAIHRLPAALVTRQIRAVLDDVGADAVKTGMLASREIVLAVARALAARRLPLVVDPVLRASTGRVLTSRAALRAMRTRLLPLATLLTPNLPEAEALLGGPVRSRLQMERAAESLLALGPRAVLIKGGHGLRPARDLLAFREAGTIRLEWLEGRRVRTRNTRGTGCVLSAACAGYLARGLSLRAAVVRSKALMTRALAASSALELGGGPGPIDPALGVSARRRLVLDGLASRKETL